MVDAKKPADNLHHNANDSGELSSDFEDLAFEVDEERKAADDVAELNQLVD